MKDEKMVDLTVEKMTGYWDDWMVQKMVDLMRSMMDALTNSDSLWAVMLASLKRKNAGRMMVGVD